ncbi:hypothetical protein IPZ58_10600 [Streptomyces roseoverticillatus]|uniref:hypothetical protein n=1 Tax=Streptomyces roseoverticillatus TaxID=66429 RepID=UPI001F43896F|nr:hypothetical protein [Streptomyces roseoverticillatus]MCF3102034.1 hypothetical protein [Streptomyces roseoverticillatus]
MSPRRFTASSAVVLAGLLVLGPAATAHAHGDTIRLTVTGVSAGHPVTTAVWENDGDPVGGKDEKVAGTVTATGADGTTLGPWRLVPVPGKAGSFTTAEALPAGRWTITAQTAFPALGSAEPSTTEVTAASLAGPATAPSGAPAGPPVAGPSAAPAVASGAAAGSGSGGGTGPGAVALGVTASGVALAGVLAALLLRRRRARRT